MAAKHKIRVYSIIMDVRRWYVTCLGCGDGLIPRGADGWYGRLTFDAALAVGVAHQKEEQDARRAGLA